MGPYHHPCSRGQAKKDERGLAASQDLPLRGQRKETKGLGAKPQKSGAQLVKQVTAIGCRLQTSENSTTPISDKIRNADNFDEKNNLGRAGLLFHCGGG